MDRELSDLPVPHPLQPKQVYMVASGDSRPAANKTCWPAQAGVEQAVTKVFEAEGWNVLRAHGYDDSQGHGFISGQRMGMDVFETIPPEAPLLVVEAVWQYSHHVLPGLRSHRGPILTIANFSGQWPGLVGLLNLNASLAKAGVAYSSLWSEDFEDAFFRDGVKRWLSGSSVSHDVSHVRPFDPRQVPQEARELSSRLAAYLRRHKAILGVFDEGCMGMYNAIIDDELLNPLGIYKERLSQSALVAEMRRVPDAEASAVREWLEGEGMRFQTGPNPETDLTDGQIHEQCKMYIAALRLAGSFGCDAIGIQYQQGLKDVVPASDLAEGLLNSACRPPVFDPATGTALFAGRPLPHFNEVDECAGVDSLVTNWVWQAMGFDPSTTLHDLRWGQQYRCDGFDEFVWVLEISGAAPANHFARGYRDAVSERQPPMYFPLGGGGLKGVSKPGEIVWSRIFVEQGCLQVDLGRGTAVELPEQETQRRWQQTTSQWPIMHAVFHGVSRDQMMARHKANHVNVVYAPSAEEADRALMAKAATFHALGLEVHLCGAV